jgi:hypothetical protein
MLQENYKAKAEEFFKAAKEFSRKNFACEPDLKTLIYAGFRREELDKISGLAFTAKYIEGLKRVMKRAPGTPEVENIDHVKRDLGDAFQTLQTSLRDLLSDEPAEISEHFEKEYLQMDKESFGNLQQLCEDLEQVKLFINASKRSTD